MSASDHTSGGREDGRQDAVPPTPGPQQPQWAAADSGTQVFSATPGPQQPPAGAHVPNAPGGGTHPGGDSGTGGYASAGGPGGFGPPPPPGAAMPAPPPQPDANRGRGRVLFVAAVTALITSLIVGPATALLALHLTDSGQPLSSLGQGQASSTSTGDVSEVADKALPSVVSIQVGSGGGSGVIISSDGQILTNAHVIQEQEGSEAIQVQFNDGEAVEAELLGADPVSDLAVLQAEGQSGRTPAVFGDSDKVEVGADVVAIGSPLGLSGTVTSGVVSALDRPVNTGIVQQQPNQEAEEEEQAPIPDLPFEEPTDPESEQQPQAQTSRVINAIQSDAPINPGNSGGPLMNMNGEIIGINTAIAGSGGQMGSSGSIGLGFAIPINQAQPIAEQLVAEGQADYAAIEATITGMEDSSGAEIVEVAEDGAAEHAGFEEGDVITEIDGEEISDPDKLIATVRSYQPGDTITVGYERDGSTDEVDVTLSAQSAESIGN